ncbi:MAG: hypothetical protein LBD33_03485 [Puniceicoccales bacterium]|jgi:hypothetical protein|nr:hypothetical protein [Puniceicoccales bacterium]
MDSMKFPGDISLRQAVAYNSAAEALLNSASNTDASKSVKTFSVNATGVTFAYVRNQSNLICAIFIWIGGCLTRLILPKDPLNDAEAKKVLLPYLNFLGEFNNNQAIETVDVKLSQLQKMLSSAQEDISAKVKKLDAQIAAYNKGKSDTEVLPALNGDVKKCNDLSNAIKKLKGPEAKQAHEILKQANSLCLMLANKENITLAMNEIACGCAKSCEAAYDKRVMRVLNDILPELRGITSGKITGLPDEGQKFNPGTAKDFNAQSALNVFKNSKKIIDGKGGKFVYDSGSGSEGKEISKQDKKVIYSLMTAAEKFVQSKSVSNQEKRIEDCTTALKTLRDMCGSHNKDTIGFDPEKLPAEGDVGNLEAGLKRIRSCWDNFCKKTGIGMDGKYTGDVGDKKAGDEAADSLKTICASFEKAHTSFKKAATMAELLRGVPMSDTDLDKLAKRIAELGVPHS